MNQQGEKQKKYVLKHWFGLCGTRWTAFDVKNHGCLDSKCGQWSKAMWPGRQLEQEKEG